MHEDELCLSVVVNSMAACDDSAAWSTAQRQKRLQIAFGAARLIQLNINMSSILLLASIMAAGSMPASVGTYARAEDWKQAQRHVTVRRDNKAAAAGARQLIWACVALARQHNYTRKGTQTPSKPSSHLKVGVPRLVPPSSHP